MWVVEVQRVLLLVKMNVVLCKRLVLVFFILCFSKLFSECFRVVVMFSCDDCRFI